MKNKFARSVQCWECFAQIRTCAAPTGRALQHQQSRPATSFVGGGGGGLLLLLLLLLLVAPMLLRGSSGLKGLGPDACQHNCFILHIGLILSWTLKNPKQLEETLKLDVWMDIDIVDKRVNRHPWVWSIIGHPTHLYSAATASISELDHCKMVFRLFLFLT